MGSGHLIREGRMGGSVPTDRDVTARILEASGMRDPSDGADGNASDA